MFIFSDHAGIEVEILAEIEDDPCLLWPPGPWALRPSMTRTPQQLEDEAEEKGWPLIRLCYARWGEKC